MFSVILALLLGSVSVRAGPESAGLLCGSVVSAGELNTLEESFTANQVAGGQNAAAPINVHFHIVSADDTVANGNVPDSQIDDQMTVLNNDFAATGLSFTLANTSRTVSAEFFNGANRGNQLQTDMKALLRQGDATTLNVYTVGLLGQDGVQNLLGYATFPANVGQALSDDGVVMAFDTLPGGTNANSNLGRTLTHEVGHWVGLFHTFEGGCDGVGDSVDDTPPVATANFGCPAGTDSCPGGEVDAIENFMDYTEDSCMNTFSAGQITRLRAQMATFRGI